MRLTPNLGLRVWDTNPDDYDPDDLEFNLDTIDADYTRPRPAGSVEPLASLPVTGLFDGRLIYLTAASGGFAAKTIVRYNGTVWHPIGPFEVLTAVPSTGNFAGRIVLLSATDSGFPAWIIIRYDGIAWARVDKGVDVSATVPVTGNYSGRVVVLSAPDGGFKAWDVIVYTGSFYNLVGPQPTLPSTEMVSVEITSDTSTTNTADPGDIIAGFSSFPFENAPYYLHIDIPILTCTAGTNNDVIFRLRESTTNIGNPFKTKEPGTGRGISHLHPFTPTAGNHTYLVYWHVANASTAIINTTGLSPARFRIIKA